MAGRTKTTTTKRDTTKAAAPVQEYKPKASFEDEIKAKIASGAFKSPSSFGKNSQFEVDDKYLADGMLHPRFVRNSDEAISYRRSQGYLMPSEIHPDLEDKVVGANTLMLCKTEDADRRRQHIASESEKRLGDIHIQHQKYNNFQGTGYTPGARSKVPKR